MAFFYLVTTGWIVDISLCENSINSANQWMQQFTEYSIQETAVLITVVQINLYGGECRLPCGVHSGQMFCVHHCTAPYSFWAARVRCTNTGVGVGKERRTKIGPWRNLKRQHPLLELPWGLMWPFAGGLSAVIAIGTGLHDLINSGLTRWWLTLPEYEWTPSRKAGLIP